jgi:alpha-glucosidase
MSGADVGGFAGSPQPELLTRWLEVAAFHPIDRDHSAVGTNPQEPWENGTPEDVNIRRRYIEERYRLLPYIYTTAEEMSRTGLPMMRPMFLEFPQGMGDGQPIDLANSNSFLLGPDLLVAQSPNPDEVDDYGVALPPGGWYDYWTGARVDVTDGGVQLHRTLETLPVFVRGGAIVPEQPLAQSTEETPQGPLTLRVYPPAVGSKDCTGSVYMDDGVSYAFKKGQFLREGFTCHQVAEGITVTVAPREGSFGAWWKQLSIEVYGQGKPAAASSTVIDGEKGAVTPGFDSEHHRITALVPDDGKGLELNLVY